MIKIPDLVRGLNEIFPVYVGKRLLDEIHSVSIDKEDFVAHQDEPAELVTELCNRIPPEAWLLEPILVIDSNAHTFRVDYVIPLRDRATEEDS